MKKIVTYLMLLSLVLLVSCGKRSGSGNVLTEIRDVQDFNSISISGDMTLAIMQRDRYDVRITADDNIVGSIYAIQKGGCLYVECRNQPISSNISVVVTMPSITYLETKGHVPVTMQDKFSVHDFEVRLSGNGSITCKNIVSDGAIKLYNFGSGNINFAGQAAELSCVTRDAGNILADNLVAGSVVAKVAGSGSSFVNTVGSLSVIVAGSGSLVYSGKPSMISKYITGSGSIEARQ